MAIKMKKTDPLKKKDQERYDAAADKKAAKLGMTKEAVRDAYSQHKDNHAPDALKSNGGKPAMQKTRAKGSTTHTVAGKPVKGKIKTVAKYGKGTSGIRMKKKGKGC